MKSQERKRKKLKDEKEERKEGGERPVDEVDFLGS